MLLFLLDIFVSGTMEPGCAKPIVSGSVATYGGNCSISNEYIKTGGLISSFTEIIISNGPAVIQKDAFEGCTSLEKIMLSNSIQDVQENAFPNSPRLMQFEVDHNNEFISADLGALLNFNKTKLIRVAQGLRSYTIPESVEYIESRCFRLCIMVKIIIPPRVTHIGVACFAGKNIQEVCFAKGSVIKRILTGTFYWGTAVKVHIPPSVVEILRNAFDHGLCEEIIFDEIEKSNLTKIGVNSLAGLNIKKLQLPDGILSFPSRCFAECTNLIEINIPSKCSSIDPSAFSGCPCLSKITIGASNSYFRYNNDGALVDKDETMIYMIKEDTTKLNISSTIKSIASSVLQSRKYLTMLEVDSENEFYSSYDNILYNKDNTTLQAIPGGILRAKIHPNATTIMASAGFSCSIEVFDCRDSKNLKTIQDFAFKGSNLTHFIFPSSITSIQTESFRDCANLINISFEPGCKITSIGNSAFRYSGLRRVELPDSVESMYSFLDCTYLEDFIISENSKLRTIKDSGFTRCTRLKNFTIYPNLKYIGENSFAYCPNLVVDFSRSRLISIGNQAFAGCKAIRGIYLPSTLESLGFKSFVDCVNVVKIEFDQNFQITFLNSSCFDKCSGLTEVELPKSLTTIDYSIFHGCTSLKNISISAENSNLKSVDGVVYDFEGKNLIFCVSGKETVNVIEGISGINGNAFFECSLLKEIYFPSYCSVQTIKANTFMGCVKLSSIEIPPSVGILESGSFSGCKSLSSVKFGDESSLKTIGEETFSSCKMLTKVIFGNVSSLDTISPRAFSGCSLLTTFTFIDSLHSIGESAFSGTGIKSIKFGEKSKIKYDTKSFDGMNLHEEFTFSANSESFPSRMFNGCDRLRSIKFPINCRVTEIPEEAFVNAINLETIVFSHGIRYIRSSAFKRLKSLYTVSGIDKIVEIESEGFFGTNLNTISLKSIEKLGESSFENCKSLSSVIFLDKMKLRSIPSKCFSGCCSLNQINLSMIEKIGEESFAMTGFREIILEESVLEVDNRCFMKCEELIKVVVKSKKISLKNEVFQLCESLKSIRFCGTKINCSDNIFGNMNCENVLIYVPFFYEGAKISGIEIIRRLGEDCGILPSIIENQNYPEINCSFLAAVIMDDCSSSGAF